MQGHLKDVHYKALTGSKAYGLANENSDDDWRGFYIPPSIDWFKMSDPVEQLQTTNGEDYSYWELRKFFRLVIQNNPNVLESLWSPVVIYPHPDTEEVLKTFIDNNRNSFITKKIIKTYGGYATSQLHRGEDYINRGKTREGWKHLMHLCRLLIQGRKALLEGDLKVDVGEYRDRLLEIRREEWTMDQFKKWHAELEAEFVDAQTKTKLSDKVDEKLIEKFVTKMRLMLLDKDLLIL